MRCTAAPALRGFTLIEVLIALVVVALGIGALLSTLTASAGSVADMRDRSFAEWVALNRISEVRLQRQRPEVGTTDGEAEFGGSRWQWRQEVSDPEMAGMLRVDVSVGPLPAGGEPAQEFRPIVTAFGFLGTAIAPASGIDPDWSLESARAPGPPGDGGGDGERPPRGGGGPPGGPPAPAEP
jgi:general secretion pathway protein I